MEMKATELAKFKKLVGTWINDPIKFVCDIWKLEPQVKGEKFKKGKHISWQQMEMLQTVKDGLKNGRRKIAIKAGKGIGKSVVMSWLLLWFLFTRPEAQIPCTAPTTSHMHDVLWKEVKIWIDRMPPFIGGMFEWTNDYIRHVEKPMTWFARAKTGKKESPEALAGVHGEHVMMLIDEGCFDEETEILTQNGFKYFKDLKKSDFVLSMEDKARFVKPTAYQKYTGEHLMYSVKKRGADFSVTDNHRMLYYTKWTNGLKLKEISGLDRSGNVYFPRKVDFDGNTAEVFIVPEYISSRKTHPRMSFSMKDWVSFVGWYLSEGCLLRGDYIGITQSRTANPIKCLEIEKLLTRMGLKYSLYGDTIHLRYPQIGKELSRYGKGFLGKRVPAYIRHSVYAKDFLDTFVQGDGYIQNGRRVFYTSSPKMADDIQEMLYLSGCAGTKKERKIEGKKWHKDHFIQTLSQSFVIYERAPSGMKFSRGNLSIKKKNNTVYCVTVPSGKIFVRRNGFCMWAGNSGVADECYEGGKGTLTNKNTFVIIISNPTRLIGYFYRIFKTTNDWVKLHFNSEESPLVDETFCKMIEDESGGKDTDAYRVNVTGEFPNEDAVDAGGYTPLLKETDIHECEATDDEFTGCRMGVDPAGSGGDKAVWVIRNKFKAQKVGEEPKSTPKSIAAKTLTLMHLYGIKGEDVYIDNFGEGANVAQELALAGVRVHGVNVGDEADDKERYINKRAEVYWRIKEWLRSGGELKKDGGWKELLGIRYRATLGKTRFQIMPKKDMIKLGIKSPNIADALSLTFYYPDFFESEFRQQQEGSQDSDEFDPYEAI